MSTFFHIFVLVSVMALTSCGTPQMSLKPALEATLPGHTIACVRQQTGPFGCVTPSQALIGGAMVYAGNTEGIGAMMEAAGKGVAAKTEDPGLKIEKGLMNLFTHRFGMKARPTLVVLSGSAPAIQPATGADYVLEIGPVGWRAVYFPTAWLRYRIVVGAAARLMDARTHEILARGRFDAMPTKLSDEVSYSDVMDNTNGVVTRNVNEATRQIIEKFTQQVFVPPTAPR